MPDLAAQVAKSLVYQTSAPASQIQNDIEQLRQMDKTGEQRQSLWSWLIGGSVVFALLGLLVGLSQSWQNLPVFGSMIVIGVIGLVLGLVMRSVHGRANVEDRRYELLAQLLDLLSRDMATDAPVQVQLELGKPNSRAKFVRKGKVGTWNVSFFEDKWLQLRGRFLDGTAFELLVTELTQMRSKWKTSASGKSKHKSKTKSATGALLRLKPKTGKYPKLTQLAPDSAGAIQLPDWSELKSLSVADGAVLLKVGVKTDWDVAQGHDKPARDGVNLLAMMFLSLYQILNLSRAIGKAARRGTES